MCNFSMAGRWTRGEVELGGVVGDAGRRTRGKVELGGVVGDTEGGPEGR